MLEIIDQTSIHFEELSAMQFGWEAEFTQLGPAEQASRVNLLQSDNAGTCHFHFNSKFDQRMYVPPDYYSFGLLEPDTTNALVQGKTAPPRHSNCFSTPGGDAWCFQCRFSRQRDPLQRNISRGYSGNSFQNTFTITNAHSQYLYFDRAVAEPFTG